MRNFVQALTEGVQDAAFFVDRNDRIGFVAALNEPRGPSLRVAGDP